MTLAQIPAVVLAASVLPLPLPLAQAADLPIDKIKLPPGFRIETYARELPGARSLTLSPGGVLWVGSQGQGKVYAVPKAGQVITVASGLHTPNGVAFHEGALYVAEISRILRYDGIEAKVLQAAAAGKSELASVKPAVVIDTLPADRWHGWKFIAFGPDGYLYVPVGAPCNVCEPDARHANISRVKPDGAGKLEVFARGIRNTVGFDWDPSDRTLWFTDNGRDYLGDDRPPDELNHAPRAGMDFGFPYCHGRSIPDPEFARKSGRDCRSKGFTPPEVELPAHVASLGMRFYEGAMFPAEYKGRIFIAEHGSWNRSTKIGYRISQVTVKDRRAVAYRPFAEGWLQGEKEWGRPVDVQVATDGALLVSDDEAGAVYRISYGAN